MDQQPAQESIEQTCIAIIAKSKLIPEASVRREMTFDELHIDSLDKINISFEIEDTFHIQIPDDSINRLKTVGDIIDGVIRLQGESAARAAKVAAGPASEPDVAPDVAPAVVPTAAEPQSHNP